MSDTNLKIIQDEITTDRHFLKYEKAPMLKQDNKNYHYAEECCRAILEDLFPNYKFPMSYPKWNINPYTGHKLELDGYNEELGLAFEYNGQQHYVYPNGYHKSLEEFLKQKRRDLVKYELCNLNDTYLIVIPYTIPIEGLKSFIEHHLPHNVILRHRQKTQ